MVSMPMVEPEAFHQVGLVARDQAPLGPLSQGFLDFAQARDLTATTRKVSVEIIRQRRAEKHHHTQYVPRHAEPVLGKRGQQNDDQQRNEEDPRERQSVGQVHCG